MKKITILTGAGISAPSGLHTFRDSDGLWNNHKIEDVCVPEALERNYDTVINFYDDLKKKSSAAIPNLAHISLTDLQSFFHVDIITQNVDDLHERAGNKNIIHMHGSLYATDYMLDGRPRPDITFFNETPKRMFDIQLKLSFCDEFWVIGTSGQVYPAAGFIKNVATYNKPKPKIVWFNLNKNDSPKPKYIDEYVIGNIVETLPAYVNNYIKENTK